MGEVMTRDEILARVRKANPGASVERLMRYADAAAAYMEAHENIERNGVLVSHPRTGAPMANPYLSIREAASRVLAAEALDNGGLWRG